MHKLKHTLLVILLMAGASLPAHTAQAARMGRGVQGWWIGYQNEICRDGATLAWLWDLPTFGGAHSTLRLWEGPVNTGRLIGFAPMQPGKHDTPVPFVIDENGERRAFDVYDIRDVSWWPLLLGVGTTISIEDPALEVTLTATVTDCLLSSPPSILLERTQPITIGAHNLRAPTLAIPEDQLRYRILSLPLYGSLTLSNTALITNSIFYQRDINEGRLRYAPSTDPAVRDSFDYALDGMVRVSQGRDGLGNLTEAVGVSFNPQISGNGAAIAFASNASNLDDTQTDVNGNTDVFLWLGNATTRRVSSQPDGSEAIGPSAAPALSANGARVAFASESPDLVLDSQDCPASPEDSTSQVYRRDVDITLNTGVGFTTTVRQSASNGPPPACQRGNSTSYSPAVAADGSVVFLSGADNLITPTVDANGNISDVFQRTLSNTTALLSLRPSTAITYFGVNGFSLAGLSADERLALDASDEFTLGDTNGFDDVFLQYTRGPRAGQIITASIGPSGQPANNPSYAPRFSRDGRWLVFESDASNLATSDNNGKRDIFVRDMTNNTIRRVSTTSNGGDVDGDSYSAHFSADGRWLTFVSSATNLVTGDSNGKPDIFVRDMQTDRIYLVSQSLSGVPSDGFSGQPVISDDGHHIAFDSNATNLVTLGAEPSADIDSDVFVRYFDPGRTLMIYPIRKVFMPLLWRG